MSTISSARAAAQGAAGHSRSGGLAATLKRLWVVYSIWRVEQAAIAKLRSMNDMALKDIGLDRAGIISAVRGEAAGNRAFTRYD